MTTIQKNGLLLSLSQAGLEPVCEGHAGGVRKTPYLKNWKMGDDMGFDKISIIVSVWSCFATRILTMPQVKMLEVEKTLKAQIQELARVAA